MKLAQRIEHDFVAAYKSKQTVKVAVLRMLKTAMTNREKDVRRELEDADILDLIAKQVKQRKESIEQFDAAKRADLADRERAELAELEGYLPRALTPDELAAAIDALISEIRAETGAATMKDMGRVMQALASAHKGRYDGRTASDLVRAKLAG
ncbi:MAG: GatB/YqeY domain-containing protein [Desulfovibrionaceae bacterium]